MWPEKGNPAKHSSLPAREAMCRCPPPIDEHSCSKQQNERSQQQYQVSSLACLGLTLQMTLMYTGTIANRTIDKTQPSWEWLPPKLTAVHYVIRDAFAIRDNWFVRWLRSQPLGQGEQVFVLLNLSCEGLILIILSMFLNSYYAFH